MIVIEETVNSGLHYFDKVFIVFGLYRIMSCKCGMNVKFYHEVSDSKNETRAVVYWIMRGFVINSAEIFISIYISHWL